MARVLAPGGQLMIYVWAMEQKNRRFEKQDVLVPWNRALCSRQQQQQQLLQRQLSGWGSGSSEAGTRTQGGRAHAGRGLRPPCSQCACSACFAPRGDSRRSHSMDEAPVVARRCCGESAKEGEDENGFYNTLGKSFRSWFFSRSLDESTLRKQIERVKPAKTPEGWADGTVSIQPSRHPSLDWDPQEVFPPKDPNSDEEVLVETPAQRHGRRLRARGAGRSGAEGRRGPRALDAREDPAGAGDPEAGAAACAADASAFMRYYHVFREGELCELLREHVPQLRILSSGNDHGNWCVVAEKRESRG